MIDTSIGTDDTGVINNERSGECQEPLLEMKNISPEPQHLDVPAKFCHPSDKPFIELDTRIISTGQSSYTTDYSYPAYAKLMHFLNLSIRDIWSRHRYSAKTLRILAWASSKRR